MSKLQSKNKDALIALALFVLVEVFFFNISFWETIGLNEETLPTKTIQSGESTTIELILAEPIDINTVNLSKFTEDLSLVLADEGNQLEYEINLDQDQLKAPGGVVLIHSYGKVKSLKIIPSETDGPISASIKSIVINQPVPFWIGPVRLLLGLSLVLLLYFFRHKSKLFKMQLFQGKRAIICFTSLTVCLSLCFGVASFINTRHLGTWEGDASDPFAYEYSRSHHYQYSHLAQAFLDGKLYISDEPPAFLEQMDNPYDMRLRNAMRDEADSTYLLDTVYFNGKYYVYFGVLPVLVFYLPWLLLTGHSFPTFLGIIVCLIAFIAGSNALLMRILRRWFKNADVGVYLLLATIVALSSMVIYAAKHNYFHLLPCIMGIALMVWSAFLALDPKKRVATCVASVALATLVIACRPQQFLMIILLVPFYLSTLRAAKTRVKKAKLLTGVIVVALVIITPILIYNYARFGNILDFGANYNLTTNDMTHRESSLSLVIQSLFYYFVAPPVIHPYFPFLVSSAVSLDYAGLFISEDMFGGLIWLAPVVLYGLLAFYGKSKKLTSFFLACLFVSLVIAGFDSIGAGILPRYAIDFAYPLGLAGAITFMYWSTKRGHSLLLRDSIIACLIIMLFINAGILFFGGESVLGYGLLLESF